MTILRINKDQFKEKFNLQHFIVLHELVNHPLFQIPRLMELAAYVSKRYPKDIYYDRGVTDAGAKWESKGNDFSVNETMRSIETAKAWIDIKTANRDSRYQTVLDTCISDLLEVSGDQLRKKIRRTQMAIFITSPNRISTYHIDSECNFLLQLQGEKDLSLFSKYDREVLPEEEIEKSWAVDTNAAIYKPHLEDHAHRFTLSPGMGVHIPVNAPHWVRNQNNISVSVAILYHWYNNEYANVYAANYALRKIGLKPTPPFRSKMLDTIKKPLGAAFSKVRSMRHGPIRTY